MIKAGLAGVHRVAQFVPTGNKFCNKLILFAIHIFPTVVVMQWHFLPWCIREDEPDGNGKEKSAVWKPAPQESRDSNGHN